MLQIPCCLNNRLKGGKVVNLTTWPRSAAQKYFMILICVRGRVNPMSIVRLEGLGKLKKKIIALIGIRIRYLPTYSASTNESIA
jgi:hypothetical protein